MKKTAQAQLADETAARITLGRKKLAARLLKSNLKQTLVEQVQRAQSHVNGRMRNALHMAQERLLRSAEAQPDDATASNNISSPTSYKRSKIPLTVATYNIHKGTLGIGPTRRNTMHQVREGIAQLEADIVFLQEVQSFHRRNSQQFADWPQTPQHEFLAPDGFVSAYHTNAVTKFGEHGNALLSRYPIHTLAHHDISDHRFEQRGLLHVVIDTPKRDVHCIVIHFGLFAASRLRQAQRLTQYIHKHVNPRAPLIVAGDSNDWGQRLDAALKQCDLEPALHNGAHPLTFPARLPALALDRIYVRGLQVHHVHVPRGVQWAKRSDHAPLVAQLWL